jgi:hypothetical protein
MWTSLRFPVLRLSALTNIQAYCKGWENVAVHPETRSGLLLLGWKVYLTLRTPATHVNLALLVGRRDICRVRSERGDRLLRYFFVEVGQRRLQRDLENLVHGVDEVQLHRAAQVFGDFGDIFLVVFGKDDFEESGAVSRQQFFFQTADGENFAAQRDFAGHGQVAAHGNFAKCAGDSRSNRDAGGWAIFRDCAFGHVNV